MMVRTKYIPLLTLAALLAAWPTAADVPTPVPQDQRGRQDAERAGQHDANNMRTIFWNYGMVGDYPRDPGNVDLSVFHSVEVPKGSGMNYSDGITPFVLAKITQNSGVEAYIMETGFRERQGTSPFYNRDDALRAAAGLLPARPGASIPAVRRPSATTRAPGRAFWPDRLDDPDDPGWSGSLERLLRQAGRRRPGELHGPGRRLLRRLGLLPRQPRPHAPRAGPAHRGPRLPVGQSRRPAT